MIIELLRSIEKVPILEESNKNRRNKKLAFPEDVNKIKNPPLV